MRAQPSRSVSNGVVDQLVAELDERPRKDGDLDGTVEVFEDEHRHLVALLGELAGQVGDDAQERDQRAAQCDQQQQEAGADEQGEDQRRAGR